MPSIRKVVERVRGVFGDRTRDSEFDDEMQEHLRLLAERYVRQGMAAEEAALAARRQFGNITLLREDRRAMQTIPAIEAFGSDLTYAARTLRKNLGFTAAAVVTLAIGIGANTAIFSVLNAVLLRPLPYAEPGRLVALWETSPQRGGDRWRVAPGTFLDWRERSHSFEDMAAFGAADAVLTGEGEPERLEGARVSVNYFSVLGVGLVAGRGFVAGEDAPGADPVVVLGHALWQRRFASDPGVVGRTILLDGIPTTIVGVMPPGIYPSRPMTSARIAFDPATEQFWVPMHLSASWTTNRTTHILGVVARLRRGVANEQASAEMSALARQLGDEFSENAGEGAFSSPLSEEVVGDLRGSLVALWGAVALVWLIAVANVVNMLLARVAARGREIAVREALGAGGWRLRRLFFVEGFLLALVGGLVGVLLAVFGVAALADLIPRDVPRIEDMRVDGAALAFTGALVLVTSVAFGVAPSLRLSGGLWQSLQEGRALASGAGRQRFRRALVVVQVGLAVVLVTGAGLLGRSFWHLEHVDPGFASENVLVAELTLPRSKYSEWHRVNAFYAALLDRVRAVPGVRSAAVGYEHPLSASWINSFTVEGRPEDKETPSGRFCPVSPEYFLASGIPLARGRVFDDADEAGRPGVAVVNETLAARYFPGADPLGKRLLIGPPSAIWGEQMPKAFEIVGVVQDVKFLGLAGGVEPGFYVPARQSPLQEMTLVVRAERDPLALAADVRAAVWEIDPDQPVAAVRTMDDVISTDVGRPRLNAFLSGLFGGLAMTLALVGLYGLLSFMVAQRTREVGVRMAIGARPADVLRMVVGEGLAMVSVGIVAGLVGALASGRLVAGLLFDVDPVDPFTFTVAPAAFAAAAVVACLIPALRATRVNPADALRHD